MTPRTLATRLIDAWTAECRKPGAHTFEDVAVPLLEEWRRGWAPSEVPVFTARWVKENAHLTYNHFADAINDRLATFRPAPASEPDLQRMQDAWIRADNKYANSGNQSALFARYLAAEGFRLGEPAAAETNLYKDGYNTGRQHAATISEAAIQSRINAAVLAEREACAGVAKSVWSHCLNGSQIADAIRARTTNAEVAALTTVTASKEDVSLGDAPAAGESPAPSRKVTQLTPASETTFMVALCDDGTMWALKGADWEQIPPIPQPGETL